VLFATIIVLAAGTTLAQARTGGFGGAQQGQGMGMSPAPNGRGWHYPNLPAPPIPVLMGEPSGTTGGFAPGGGSGTKPGKKPNLQ
jgi:hypothetical protein